MKFIKKHWKETIFILVVVLGIGFGVYKVATSGGEDTFGLVTAEAEVKDLIKSDKFHGIIEANESRDVYSLVSAKIMDVKVQNNDFVHAGDVLVVLDSADAETSLQKSEAMYQQAKADQDYSLAEKQLQLSKLLESVSKDYDAEILSHQQSLLTAQQTYDDLLEKYNIAKYQYENETTPAILSAKQALKQDENTMSYLSDSKAEDLDAERSRQGLAVSQARETLEQAKQNAKIELDNMENALEAAAYDVQKAKEQYDATLFAKEYEEKSVRMALDHEADSVGVKNAEIDLQQATEAIDRYTIKAPVDGYVSDLDIKVGDNLDASKCLMKIQNYDAAKVKIDVDEYDLEYFEIGNPVTIFVRALQKEYDGTVTEKAMTATQSNDISFIKTTITFKPEEQISSGLGAEIEFIKEKAEGALCIPTDYVDYDDETMEPYVMVLNGDKAEKRFVTLGMANEEDVQILDGLSEGETVQMSLWD